MWPGLCSGRCVAGKITEDRQEPDGGKQYTLVISPGAVNDGLKRQAMGFRA